MKYNENVYADISSTIQDSNGNKKFVASLKDSNNIIKKEKVLFGTDFVIAEMFNDCKKSFVDGKNDFKEYMDKFAWENYLRFVEKKE
jgi:predicted TIM-barrel fold metal-dependent hydrolase